MTQGTRIDWTTALDQRTKWIVLFGVLLGLFLAALDQTIVATALPRIVDDLHALDQIAWVATSYLLASTTMVPIYGRLSDTWGRKGVLVTGIVLFLTGSVLCGLAPTMLTLVLFRALQGLGAAALFSTAFAVPADLFVPAERARYQGIFGSVFGLASIVGPWLGGVLTDQLSWRWVFYVNVPIGLVALAFVLWRMPRLHSGVAAGRFDWTGAALLVPTTVPLLLALTLDKTVHPWTSPVVIGLVATSLVAGGLLAFVEWRDPARIIPVELFATRTFALVVPISVLVGAALITGVLFLATFLVAVRGISTTSAGLTLVPTTLGMMVTSVGSGVVIHRTGKWKVLSLLGLLTACAGFAWLSAIDAETSLGSLRLRTAVVGLGLGPVLPVLNLVLQNAVPRERIGAATASRQFFQQLGQATGSAVFGTVLATTLATSLAADLGPLRTSLPADVARRLDPVEMKNDLGAERRPLADALADEASAKWDRVRGELDASAHGDVAAATALDHEEDVPEEVAKWLADPAAGVAEREAQIDAALRTADPVALTIIARSPMTSPEVASVLAGLDPAALRDPTEAERAVGRVHAALDAERAGLAQKRADALAAAKKAVDDAEAADVAQARATGAQVDDALKRGFSRAIDRVYLGVAPLMAIAFLLMLFVPETPLRRTSTPPTIEGV